MTLATKYQNTFIENLPKTSLCADNYKFGSHIRNKAHAIRHQHIELNSPFKCNFISLDIDYPVAPDLCFIWESNNLPEPTFAVINPANNHAHLIFQLEKPIYTNNEKQLAYFQDVKLILKDIYKADKNFTESLTKNPLHPDWKTIESGITYTLEDLKAYAPKRSTKTAGIIQLNKYKRRTINYNNADLGHRCQLFETSRIIAYNEVRNFTSHEDFFTYMIGVCTDQNPSDLKYSDILSTAKSISRYTWKHRHRYSRGYTRNKVTSIEDLRSRQRNSATTTAGTRQAKTLAAIESAIKGILTQSVAMPAITKQYLAKLTGKSLSTIKRYAAEIDRFIRCVHQVLSPVLPLQEDSTGTDSLAQLNIPLKHDPQQGDTSPLAVTLQSSQNNPRSPILSATHGSTTENLSDPSKEDTYTFLESDNIPPTTNVFKFKKPANTTDSPQLTPYPMKLKPSHNRTITKFILLDDVSSL